MKKGQRILLCLIVLFLCVGTANAEVPKKIHGECSDCHKGTDYKAVKTVINETCAKCHPTSKGRDHPVGVVSPVVPADLPLSEGNKVTCVTCHEPHGKNTVGKLLRKSFNDLCIECHNN